MKKVSGTRRLLAVVLTIAMLLQNSAGVLATDGANAVSNLPQEQSTEQPDVNAASEQTDAGAQDGENTDVSKKNEAPETQAPQTDAPQTDEPETAAPETQATATEAPQTAASETQASETETPQTSAPETNAPQTDAPETDVPKAQETPGLTQPGGDKTGTDEAGADKESSLIQGNENSESAETQKEFAIGNNASEKDEEEAANILLEDGIMPIAGPEYITKISFDINAADATWEAPESIGVKKDDEASIDPEGDEVTYSYTIVKDGEEKTVETNEPPALKDVADSIGDVTVTVKRGEHSWTKTVKATITARKVVLQSADLSKKYDGQPLVNGNTPLVLDGIADESEILGEQEGWLPGEDVSWKFTGSQTEVGSSANTFDVVAGDGTDLANYAIEKKEGTLTVTEADAPQTETETETDAPQTESETNAPQTETETNAPQTETEANVPQTETETDAPQTETETNAPQTKPDTEVSKTDLAKLTVTKSIINEADRHLLGLDGATFYVALFSDAKLTKRVGDVRKLSFDLNTAVASVTYKNLKPGTYYVSEVNAGGKPVSSGRYGGGAYTAVYTGDVQKVTIAKGARTARFSFENWFLELPEEQYYKDLGLPKDKPGEEAETGDKAEKQTETQSGSQIEGQTDAVGEGTEAVKTGDSTPIERMLLLFVISGMLLLLAEERRRRRRV